MSIFTDGTRACSCRQHNLTENMLHAALTNSFRKSAQSRLLNRTYDLKRASMVAPMDTATHFRSRAPRSATKEKSEAKPASTATRQNTRTLRDLLPTCGSSCKLRAAPRRTRPLKGRRMPTDPPPMQAASNYWLPAPSNNIRNSVAHALGSPAHPTPMPTRR